MRHGRQHAKLRHAVPLNRRRSPAVPGASSWARPAVGLAALLATVAALLTPLSALAGPGGHPEHPRVAPGLAKQAAAHPDDTFQVIVQGQPGTTSDGVANAVGKARAARRDASGPAVHDQFKAISGVAATLTGSDIQALADDQSVAAIMPDLPVASTGRPGNPRGGGGGPAGGGPAGGGGGPAVGGGGPAVGGPAGGYSNDQIWPQDAGVSPLWPLVSTAKLPTIAIVDSGVDPGPISKHLLTQVNLYTGSGQNSKFDGFGHGTMVAGIASLSLAHHAGAAPGANIVSLDVLDDQGAGVESDAIAAADWILQNKDTYNIKVANFSLSTGVGTSVLSDPLDAAVEKLWLSGITVVAAAGNYGTDAGPSGVVTAPANDPFVITVGAADTNGTADPSDDFAAPWSAYGYTPDGFAKPELGAPGRMINGPVPSTATLLQKFPKQTAGLGYMAMSGTSFAAPIVSGTAADLLALHPGWTPDQIKGALMVSAARYTNSAQFALGVGIVNGAAATNVPDPPNTNAGLDRFVTTDPATGLPVFDAQSWASAAAADMSWASMSWASMSWASMSWASMSWASMSWASMSWASSSSATASWATAINANANPDG